MLTKRVIYQESQEQFLDDAMKEKVAKKMLEESEKFWIHPWDSEINSWKNNARSMSSLLRLSNVEDTYVTFEYAVPYSKKRIDCMIYGKWSDDKWNVVHIELKQRSNTWVKALDTDWNFEEDGEYNVEAYTWHWNRIVAHPSQQVRWYNDYLLWFVEVFSTEELYLDWVAYCYNYERRDGEWLYNKIYDNLQKEFRTYSQNEVQELANKLHEVLQKWDGFSIFNKVIQSNIRPSKKLLDSAATMIHEKNTKAFSLIDDQIVAKNMIMDKIRKLEKFEDKSVIIVKWWPWTWKTVIALNMLAELAKTNYKVFYSTKSKSLMSWILDQLPRWSDWKKLFTNLNSFVPADCKENAIDVLLVDEAHRIEKSPNNRFTPSAKRTDLPQIDTLIRASKIWVFFIDDMQPIRPKEIWKSDMIRESATRYWCIIEEIELKSQFRCNGSDNYLDWLESVLYNKTVSSLFNEEDYDFKVFNSPDELYSEIVKKNNEEWKTARLTAWFCWPWSSTLDENWNLVKDVHIWNFAMPWETHMDISRPPQWYPKWYEWAYKPDGIKQVWCIYTAQGFEFDYIWVIIWPDLIYRKWVLETNISWVKDPTLMWKQGVDWYIRNIYRVLMSRWMKGCYIYSTDSETREYFKRISE